MTISLPMRFGSARMTIRTGNTASIRIPGLALPPISAAAAIGRPIGRIVGTGVRRSRYAAGERHAASDRGGRATTVLGFVDTADLLVAPPPWLPPPLLH